MSNFNNNCFKIELKNLHKSFKQKNIVTEVLTDINFKFEQNFTYSLKGISGTGKSTLIHLLSGLDIPTQGSVFYNNCDINSLNSLKKRVLLQNSIGLIFQFSYLLKELNILENVMLKGLISGEKKEICETKAFELLKAIGLQDKALNYPQNLSGGEQQRVSIARALFNEPAFLIADEPTAHLDEKNKGLILDLLLQYKSERNMGLIIASHDPTVFKSMNIQIEIFQNAFYSVSSDKSDESEFSSSSAFKSDKLDKSGKSDLESSSEL